MTDDIRALVERLRNQVLGYDIHDDEKLVREAAAALERLAREVRLWEACGASHKELKELFAPMMHERDALKRELAEAREREQNPSYLTSHTSWSLLVEPLKLKADEVMKSLYANQLQLQRELALAREHIKELERRDEDVEIVLPQRAVRAAEKEKA